MIDWASLSSGVQTVNSQNSVHHSKVILMLQAAELCLNLEHEAFEG